MATVYRAVHERLRKPMALKVLHDFVAEDRDYLARFLREARAAAQLSHRNIVKAYEAGEHRGLYYFAMEYVEGEDLGERLGREECLDEEEALRIALELARALEAAEAHGMVHRDIKPENVLLGREGEVKLADLGLAKVQGDGYLTAEGYTLGTVAFFSPEQCRGSRDLDVRSDLYALGALLYNVIGGSLPFGRGDNPVLTMQRILEEEPPPIPADRRPSLPTQEAIAVLMAKHRDDRPQNAAEAVELLEETLAAVRGDPPKPSSSASHRRLRPRRRRRAVVRSTRSQGIPVGLVLLLGALGAILGLILALSADGHVPATPRREAGAR
jgi:serine/threonine-protein kinase